MRDEKIGIPILLGNKQKINKLIKANSLDLEDIIVIDPNEQKAKLKQYGQLLYDKRKRKGLTLYEAKKLMKDRNYFGAMMVELGEGDALISGLTKDYPRTILPSLQI